MTTDNGPELKYSVYISLGSAAAIAITDLAVNHSIAASREIVIALIGFAGIRQVIKSAFKV